MLAHNTNTAITQYTKEHQMDRMDLMEHTLKWVWGACVLWNQHAKLFDMNSVKFQEFVHRTHDVAWKHLTQGKILDSSCSDFECCISLDAKRLFGVYTR